MARRGVRLTASPGHPRSDVTRADAEGRLWQVAQIGPRLGQPEKKYTLTGPDYEATDYPTREDAMAAGDATISVRAE